MFTNKVKHSEQEYGNRQLIDKMHRLNAEIGWPVWIFLSKKITPQFS